MVCDNHLNRNSKLLAHQQTWYKTIKTIYSFKKKSATIYYIIKINKNECNFYYYRYTIYPNEGRNVI